MNPVVGVLLVALVLYCAYRVVRPKSP